ncbi:hypothetical protein DXB22_15035 [Clostridiaceae bacterium OM02-2AC]|nr:hypothetical protein DXB22_15035 [Clostridiaceae bacterium OM02-2AC]
MICSIICTFLYLLRSINILHKYAIVFSTSSLYRGFPGNTRLLFLSLLYIRPGIAIADQVVIYRRHIKQKKCTSSLLRFSSLQKVMLPWNLYEYRYGKAMSGKQLLKFLRRFSFHTEENTVQ